MILSVRKRRPVGVWLVLFYAICSVLLTTWLQHFARYRVSPETKAYQEHLTTLEHVAIVVPGFIWEAAIVLLFFLRKLAVPLFALAICSNLASEILLAMTTNWLVLLKSGIYVVAFFYLIDLAILLYAIRLARKGILY
jgi:hypothetical protein